MPSKNVIGALMSAVAARSSTGNRLSRQKKAKWDQTCKVALRAHYDVLFLLLPQ